MKFFALVSALCAAAAAVAVPLEERATSGTATVSYDPVYDNKSGDMTTVACSDGTNGMITKGKPSITSLYADELTTYCRL